jgi:site-specific recombinase XerD
MKRTRGVYEKVPGSGCWWVRYADAAGRIRREKMGNRGAAIKLYRKRKTEVLQGVKLPENFRAKPVLFSELAEDCLKYSKANKESFRHDDFRMKPLLEEFGNLPAESITPLMLERWLSDEADDREWEPATVNRYKALLSLTFRLGIDNGKVKTNPAALVKRRRENNAVIRWLSDAEEERLRAAIEKEAPQHIHEFDIALHTGMRCSEQFSLAWGDVDLTRKIVTVRRSKNGDLRHVWLNSAALSAFQTLFAQSKGEGPVFVSERGLDALQSPRHWFKPALVEAKVIDFTWHCLRHTFASRLIMRGVDLRTAQQLMGHKTIQMTCRYAHLAPEHQLAAVEKLCETGVKQDGATDTRTSTSPDTMPVQEVLRLQ